MKRRLFLALATILACTFAHATSYYVSPTGNDANSGTLALPWRTIQKAANTLAPGDTVFVRAGTYREAVTVNVSGSQTGGFVTFTNYPKETAVVDGSTLVPPVDTSALFFVSDRSYVAIQGFEVRNYKATSGEKVPCGIFVTGTSHDIQIRNNNVHAIEYDTASGNAFGIAFYGTSKAEAITNVVVDGNEVHNLKTGNSESLTINGNVTNFQVTNNHVHHNNNIGIVFIGFEKTCPDPAQDQARDGVCRGNVVNNITSLNNPAYHGDTSATGIYCDGAARVLVERNVISLCDYGSELTSEHKGRTSSDCIFRDNLVYWCLHPGLSLGGYDAAHTGGTTHCTITNNTFYRNNTSNQGDGELMFQYRVVNCTIKNNIFYARTSGLFLANSIGAPGNSGNVFDYNLYFSPLGINGSAWERMNREYDGFIAWKNVSHQDAHSIFADPKFVNTATPNLHIQTGSPAVNAGDPTMQPTTGELDIDGQPRLHGAVMDIGADEF